MTLSLTVQNPADEKMKKAAKVELPAEIFDVALNIPLIHQVVTAQLAAARQGTHSTKRRGEVRGGGKKPYKQKGTGRARQGSTRAPQFTGGGIVHGPKPRDYAQRTPKKMIVGALRSALSDRARNGKIILVSSLVGGDAPSTKVAAASLAKITTAKNVLVVAERSDDATWQSLRNLDTVHILEPGQLNTYDVLISDDVVFTEAALAAFVAGPSKGKSVKAVATSAEVDDVVEAQVVEAEVVEAEVVEAEVVAAPPVKVTKKAAKAKADVVEEPAAEVVDEAAEVAEDAAAAEDTEDEA